MDFNTNIEIIEDREITLTDLKSFINEYLDENPNIKSIHKIYFDELIEYINNKEFI